MPQKTDFLTICPDANVKLWCSFRLAPNSSDVWWYVAYSKANTFVNASFMRNISTEYLCEHTPFLVSSYAHFILLFSHAVVSFSTLITFNILKLSGD